MRIDWKFVENKIPNPPSLLMMAITRAFTFFSNHIPHFFSQIFSTISRVTIKNVVVLLHIGQPSLSAASLHSRSKKLNNIMVWNIFLEVDVINYFCLMNEALEEGFDPIKDKMVANIINEYKLIHNNQM